ncbi:peptidase family m28 domain-containing protein [Ditylenchus destructor]|nr:peptidase family m28 domain-containing protein [Ditylenchus destructor]
MYSDVTQFSTRRRRRANQNYGSIGDKSIGQEMAKKDDNEVEFYHRFYSVGIVDWILAVALITAVYFAVEWQSNRLPAVSPADNNFKEFSEERARVLLKQLTDLGPRPAGSKSNEIDAFQILASKVASIQSAATAKNVNFVELDVQRPSWCLNAPCYIDRPRWCQKSTCYTACFSNITNLWVRIGPNKSLSSHSILLNCHFDSVPAGPGASDDAAACAVMMETLEVLANSNAKLQNDLIFLFNGAEESGLVASYGLITQANPHPWKAGIRAFINLEGAGAGGRELLFQAGPGEPWILQEYLQSVPHPFSSVIGQEIFQANLIDSDTDFRIFRDYGKLSGLDMAYVKNGYVYHTEFDRMSAISSGVIQHTGDNVLALSKALVSSPHIVEPSKQKEKNQWVFYDFIGFFAIVYPILYARIWRRTYSLLDLLLAILHHILVLVVMAAVSALLFVAIHFFKLHMFWYATPWLLVPVYMIPMAVAALTTHVVIAMRNRTKHNAEIVHYDTSLLIWCAALLFLTIKGIASAYFILNILLFHFLRIPIFFVLQRFGVRLDPVSTPRVTFYTQVICLLPAIAYFFYMVKMLVDFFVPLMGRMNRINPEFVFLTISLLVAFTLILLLNNLCYITRGLGLLLKLLIPLTIAGIIVIAATKISVPYKYSDDEPRLRRINAEHWIRYNDALKNTSTELIISTWDYRKAKDLPDFKFLQDEDRANSNSSDTLHMEYFDEDKKLKLQLITPPAIEKMLNVTLLNRTSSCKPESSTGQCQEVLNMTFILDGGQSNVTLQSWPLNGYNLEEWSWQAPDQMTKPCNEPKREVSVKYGLGNSANNTFWVALTKNRKIDDPLASAVEIRAYTQYDYGEFQYSKVLTRLRSEIASRRKENDWKWCMTMAAEVREEVIFVF